MTLRTALVIDGSAEGAKRAAQETVGAISDVRKAAGDAARDTGVVAGNLEKAGTAAGGLASKAGDAAGKLADLGGKAESSSKKIEPAATNSRDLANAMGGISPAGQAAIEKLDAMAGSADKLDKPFRNGTAAIASLVGSFTGGLIGGAISGAFEGVLTALGSYASDALSTTDNVDRALKSHIEIIRSIRGAYAEAEGGASSYGNNSVALLRFQNQQDIRRLRDAYDLNLPKGTLEDIGIYGQTGPFAEVITKFLADRQKGEADVIALRNEISKIAASLPESAGDRGIAENILEQTQPAADALEKLRQAEDTLKGLNGDSDAAARALGGAAEKYGALGAAAGSAAGQITPTTQAISEAGNAAEKAAGQIQTYTNAAAGIPSAPPGIAVSPARAAATAPTIPFAAGGIVDRPTLFGFGNGQTGLMGEAGAEAIMPLKGGQVGAMTASGAEIGLNVTRLADGSLGVSLPETFAGGGVFPTAPGGRSGQPESFRDLSADINVLRGSLSGFVSGLRSGENALTSLGSVVSRISDRFLDWAIGAVDKTLFSSTSTGTGSTGGLLGGLTPGLGRSVGSALGLSQWDMAASGLISGLFHGGGTIGHGPSATRLVSPSVFVAAPRLHQGGSVSDLSSGEVPIIAMQGEEIGWPQDLARKYGRGGTVNNFYIETPDARSFAESRASVSRAAARLSSRSGRYV